MSNVHKYINFYMITSERMFQELPPHAQRYTHGPTLCVCVRLCVCASERMCTYTLTLLKDDQRYNINLS